MMKKKKNHHTFTADGDAAGIWHHGQRRISEDAWWQIPLLCDEKQLSERPEEWRSSDPGSEESDI